MLFDTNVITIIYILQGIMIFNWVGYNPVTYGDYVYPQWAIGLGWGLACLSLVCVPIGMVKGVWESPGDTLLRVSVVR